jgi:hypothetical protein
VQGAGHRLDNSLERDAKKYTKDHSDRQGSICMESCELSREEEDEVDLLVSEFRPCVEEGEVGNRHLHREQ